MKKKDSLYDNRLVNKPWGNEYVVYRNKNNLCVTLLKINYNQSTSLHCHPQKKSGFILLNGKALFQLGLWKKRSEVHISPSKRMIARGLFHSIKSLSKEGLLALEFETPVNKKDLVRFKDNYGRSNKAYEGKKFTNLLKNKSNTIFAILNGAISDNNGRNVLSYGDIVRTNDLKVLSKVFKIKKQLSVAKVIRA